MDAVLGWLFGQVHALPETVSVFEVCWTLPAAFGFGRYLWRYQRAWRARRVLLQHAGPPSSAAYRLMGTMRAVRFLGLVLVFEFFLGMGVIAMMTPNGPANNPADAGPWIITLFLVCAELLLVFIGESADFYQHLIDRLLELTAEENGRAGDACPNCRR